MNERIKQLAEQAGYYLYDLTETHECKTVETDSTDEWITLEKFAELIVAHATECVRDVLRDENSDLSYVAARQVQNRIKEFFGVEE
jgi:hypothetical protein